MKYLDKCYIQLSRLDHVMCHSADSSELGYQWRSQNAENLRILEQAVILFNCVPFQNRNSLKSSSLFYGT